MKLLGTEKYNRERISYFGLKGIKNVEFDFIFS
jgi:hypothetical protein